MMKAIPSRSGESKEFGGASVPPEGADRNRGEKKALKREVSILKARDKVDVCAEKLRISKVEYYNHLRERSPEDWVRIVEGKVQPLIREKVMMIIGWDHGTKEEDGAAWARAAERFKGGRGGGESTRAEVAQALHDVGYSWLSARDRAYSQDSGKVQGLAVDQDDEE